MKKLRVAVIGAGMIAQSAHLPAYRYFSDRFSVCAVSDVNEKAAKDAAEKFDIPHVYTDAEEMLQSEKPDLVSVCAQQTAQVHDHCGASKRRARRL